MARQRRSAMLRKEEVRTRKVRASAHLEEKERANQALIRFEKVRSGN